MVKRIWCPSLVCYLCALLVSHLNAEESDDVRQPRRITTAEFRTLEAASGDYVSLEATVCYQDPLWKFLFLIDDGSGVYVDPVPGSYQPGDRIEVSGEIGYGHGVPILSDRITIKRLGTSHLPQAASIDLSEWDWDRRFSDPRNSGWVEIEGVVEQVSIIDDSTRLWCRGHYRLFPVTLAEAIGANDAWNLYGSRIRIRGSLGLLLDDQNRMQAPLLFTQSKEHLTVLERPPSLPFPEFPNQRISTARDDDNGAFRASGQVTLARNSRIFVDDGFAATEMGVASDFETPAGTFIEVLGVSESDDDRRAHVVVLRNEPLKIWPMKLSIGDLRQDQIGRRIRIRATVTESDSTTLVLRVAEGEDQALVYLPRPTGKELAALDSSPSRSLDLESAADVDVIGVLESFDAGIPVVCAVSQDDFRVLSRRWVLTSSNVLRLLGIVTTLLVVIGGVVLLLRRQVAARTQALSDLAAQLRASYDSVDAGVVAVGKNGKLLTINEKANLLLGASLSPGDSADKFVRIWAEKAMDPSAVYEMASAFRSDDEVPSTCEVALNDGRGTLRLTLTAINRDGKHIGNLWVLHDETQLQNLQAELFQAQKMEAVGTLAGGVAHDFNNLLTAILGNLNLLSLPNTTAEEQHSYIEQAEAACMSAGELVQQLLGMSRKTGMKPKTIDPNDMINSIRALLRHGFGSAVRFKFSTTAGLPPVHVDPNQIEQVLLNLCVNARDAMPEGGEITLTTEYGTLREQDAVVIRVSDTGEGIPRHLQSKIFEPFFTTKEVGKGTGLGLATSFSVVNRHRGELICESVPGEGATFSVLLPASDREIADEQQTPDTTLSTGQETVLIVDDEWVVRAVAARLLEMGGYRTIEVEDGEACLEVLADLRAEIDIVLLDVTMPGMSGHKVLGEIRHLYPSLPVLMCSGYDLTRKGESTFEHFLQKPFSASTLLNSVRSILDLPARAAC